MRHRTLASAGAYCLLGLAAVASYVVPDTLLSPAASWAQTAPATLKLTGTVRDFKATHVDFDVVPAGGVGHVAGNVLQTLGADGRPDFNRGNDENGPFENRVAHWKFDEGAGLTASDEMGLNPGTLLDGPGWTATGHDGGALHFDGTNDHVEIPSSPEMQINGDITFTGWFKLDADFDASSPNTLVIMEKFLDTEHDFHIALAGQDYNRSEVPKGALVFKVENGPTSDYYCYTWTNRVSWTAGVWYHFAAALVSADTGQNTMYVNGVDDTNPVRAIGDGFIDTSYDAPMRIGGKTIDYNGLATDIHFEGEIDDVMIFNRALTPGDFTPAAGGYYVTAEWTDAAGDRIAPHFHTPSSAGVTDACGVLLSDVAGTAGSDSDGGIDSETSFDQWYRDALGTNLSTQHTITLVLNGGIYEYLDDDFHPIDGKLFGNQGQPHNHYLTYALSASFTYDQCTGQFVEFEGGDGAWLFVNGQLVLDLGGIDSAIEEHVELDRLGLTDGQTGVLHLFYAQRNATSSTFRLRTNIELTSAGRIAVGTAGYD
jgi:fibro-slime domain-containing protein